MFGLPPEISKTSKAQPKIVPSQNSEMQNADVELIQENHELMEKFYNEHWRSTADSEWNDWTFELD